MFPIDNILALKNKEDLNMDQTRTFCWISFFPEYFVTHMWWTVMFYLVDSIALKMNPVKMNNKKVDFLSSSPIKWIRAFLAS